MKGESTHRVDKRLPEQMEIALTKQKRVTQPKDKRREKGGSQSRREEKNHKQNAHRAG